MQESDLCFVLNDRTFETLSGPLHIPADHIARIANGVDIRSYRPLASEEIESIKDNLGLKGKRVIIQVGSICERKNQLRALELLTPFLKENDNLVYLFVGGVIDEGYKAKLLARAAEEGLESQVIYGGEIAPGEQLNRYYNVAEAMLFPATSEAFGLVIIEAMAAGVPAIVPSQLNVNLRGYVAYANEDEFRSLFTSRILDLANNKLNTLPFNTDKFKVPVQSLNTNCTITVESDAPNPVALIGAGWIGDYYRSTKQY